MTKEEILGQPHIIPSDNVPDYLRSHYSKTIILKAMSDFAKQEAIAFAKWTWLEVIEPDFKEQMWWWNKKSDWFTDDQLYELYLQSKEQSNQ